MTFIYDALKCKIEYTWYVGNDGSADFGFSFAPDFLIFPLFHKSSTYGKSRAGTLQIRCGEISTTAMTFYYLDGGYTAIAKNAAGTQFSVIQTSNNSDYLNQSDMVYCVIAFG